MPYTLANDGDGLEQQFAGPLIQPHFPSYETFWDQFVTPLSNRPNNIQLRTHANLAALGFGDHHVCISQLHYTILQQLARCFVLSHQNPFTIDHFVFAMSSLVGAQDVAFELLERFANPGIYNPWLDKRPLGAAAAVKGGREAQTRWKNLNNYPLQDIRDYRNHLVHGRTSPAIMVAGQVMLPRLGQERNYFDWRLVTDPGANPPANHFDTPSSLFQSFFATTLAYFENAWQIHLLPHI